MDFSLGEDRQMLADTLSRFMADRYDWKARETAIESATGFDRAAWNELAELGAIGALFPEDAGGYGGGAFDIAVVFEQIGRALATGPFLASLMAGRILAEVGQGDLLDELMTGSAVVTFAHADALAPDGSMLPPMTARQSNDGKWTLSGAKGVVDFLGAADKVVVTAETDEGMSSFLIDLAAEGVKVRDYPLVDGGSAGELVLDGAAALPLGSAEGGQAMIDGALAAGLVATAWEAVAIMDVLRDSTLEYLRTRKQFGIVIGKFQALQHRMATLSLEIEQARSAAINAAANFDKDVRVRDRFCSAAKYTIGRTGTLVTEEAIQMHGGIGMTWELPLSHFAKRMTMLGHVLGDEDEHLARFIDLGRAA